MSHVAWSACLCVCVAHGWAVQKRANRSRCCLGTDSVGPKETCIIWLSRSPKGRDNFLGFFALLKSIGRLLRCTQKRLNRSRCRLEANSYIGAPESTYKMGSRLDESIHHREGWQDCDVAFRQNSRPLVYTAYNFCHAAVYTYKLEGLSRAYTSLTDLDLWPLPSKI